jgi:hypothetical protein
MSTSSSSSAGNAKVSLLIEKGGAKSTPTLSRVGKMVGSRASSAALQGVAVDSSRAAMWAQALRSSPPHSGLGGGATPSSPKGTGMKEQLQSAKVAWNKVIQSKVLVSLLVFLFTMLILIALNPPMAQEPATPDNPKGRRSWKKITIWSVIPALLTLLLPLTTCLRSAPKVGE